MKVKFFKNGEWQEGEIMYEMGFSFGNSYAVKTKDSFVAALNKHVYSTLNEDELHLVN